MKTTMWMRFSFLRFATVFVFLHSGLLGKGNDFTVGERKDAASPDSNTNCVLSLFSGRKLFDKERVLLPSKNGTARYWIEDEEETAGSNWHLVHLKCNDNGCLFRCEENERLWLLSVQTAIVMEDVDTTRNFTSRYVFLTQSGSQDSHISISGGGREDSPVNESGSDQQSAYSRAEAIRNLPFGDEQAQALLAIIARTDASELVRKAAVEKLLDNTALAEIAETEPMPVIRAEAIRKISDRKILKQFLNDKSFFVRCAAEAAFWASLPGQKALEKAGLAE